MQKWFEAQYRMKHNSAKLSTINVHYLYHFESIKNNDAIDTVMVMKINCHHLKMENLMGTDLER